MLTAIQIKDYNEKGYFIATDAVEMPMVDALREAAKRAKNKVRDGTVDVYTDWHSKGEPFHINGLIAPDFNEPIFGHYLAWQPMLDYVQAQIGTDLQLGPLGIFTNPHNEVFNVAWHRDVGQEPRDLPEAEEVAFLRRPRMECRWELALVDDMSLSVVPGSQQRYRTEHEWDVMSNEIAASLPDEEVISLKAGETLFWNGKIIHRSCQMPEVERLTLIGVLTTHKPEAPKKDVGSLRWMLEPIVRENLPPKLHHYYDQWKVMQEI